MKKLYWRPKHISHRALILIGSLSLLGLVAVERLKIHSTQTWRDEKLEASQLALKAFESVREARLRTSKDFFIDPVTDPSGSGLIGYAATPVTSSRGGYLSKRTSINPNFAAAIVDMLHQAGVKEGDRIAVATSGSFPAINICTYAAISTMKLRPTIIASAASSEWGANDPDYLWIDMERRLQQAGVFPFRAGLATLGGLEDTGKGLPESSINLLKAGVERNGLQLLLPETIESSVKERLAFYKSKAGKDKYAAYINVGGGQTSTGGHDMKEAYKPGLNTRTPPGADTKTSVMAAFTKKGTPALHLIHIRDLARNYQLPDSPDVIPEPGVGGVFERLTYNRLLAAGVLVFLIGILTIFVRTHWGTQFLRPHSAQKGSNDVEAMI